MKHAIKASVWNVSGYLDDSFVADDDVDSDATLSTSGEEELSDCSSEY